MSNTQTLINTRQIKPAQTQPGVTSDVNKDLCTIIKSGEYRTSGQIEYRSKLSPVSWERSKDFIKFLGEELTTKSGKTYFLPPSIKINDILYIAERWNNSDAVLKGKKAPVLFIGDKSGLFQSNQFIIICFVAGIPVDKFLIDPKSSRLFQNTTPKTDASKNKPFLEFLSKSTEIKDGLTQKELCNLINRWNAGHANSERVRSYHDTKSMILGSERNVREYISKIFGSDGLKHEGFLKSLEKSKLCESGLSLKELEDFAFKWNSDKPLKNQIWIGKSNHIFRGIFSECDNTQAPKDRILHHISTLNVTDSAWQNADFIGSLIHSNDRPQNITKAYIRLKVIEWNNKNPNHKIAFTPTDDKQAFGDKKSLDLWDIQAQANQLHGKESVQRALINQGPEVAEQKQRKISLGRAKLELSKIEGEVTGANPINSNIKDPGGLVKLGAELINGGLYLNPLTAMTVEGGKLLGFDIRDPKVLIPIENELNSLSGFIINNPDLLLPFLTSNPNFTLKGNSTNIFSKDIEEQLVQAQGLVKSLTEMSKSDKFDPGKYSKTWDEMETIFDQLNIKKEQYIILINALRDTVKEEIIFLPLNFIPGGQVKTAGNVTKIAVHGFQAVKLGARVTKATKGIRATKGVVHEAGSEMGKSAGVGLVDGESKEQIQENMISDGGSVILGKGSKVIKFLPGKTKTTQIAKEEGEKLAEAGIQHKSGEIIQSTFDADFTTISLKDLNSSSKFIKLKNSEIFLELEKTPAGIKVKVYESKSHAERNQSTSQYDIKPGNSQMISGEINLNGTSKQKFEFNIRYTTSDVKISSA